MWTVVVLAYVSGAVMFVTGTILIVSDIRRRRRRRPLVEPLMPNQPTPLADEAERWLRQQS
jgi:hypothetical protein